MHSTAEKSRCQDIEIIHAYVYSVSMYSVKEAAKLLGLDSSQVRRLLAQGKIKGRKLARDWVVLDISYQRRRKPKGVARNEKS